LGGRGRPVPVGQRFLSRHTSPPAKFGQIAPATPPSPEGGTPLSDIAWKYDDNFKKFYVPCKYRQQAVGLDASNVQPTP
jgi:hypothetical protein